MARREPRAEHCTVFTTSWGSRPLDVAHGLNRGEIHHQPLHLILGQTVGADGLHPARSFADLPGHVGRGLHVTLELRSQIGLATWVAGTTRGVEAGLALRSQRVPLG